MNLDGTTKDVSMETAETGYKDVNSCCFSVAMFGTFDVDNYGDCLFPLIVEHQLTKRLGKIMLYPFSPTNRLPRIANYSRVYGFNELGKTFSKPPSCFVIGGGELLRTDYTPHSYPQVRNILYPSSLKTWLLPIMVANSWNCPCVINAIGWGKAFDEEFMQIATSYLRKVDLFFVRDPFTAERLSEINVPVEVVPDSGFCVPELLTPREWEKRFRQMSSEFRLPPKYLVAQGSFYLGANHTKFTNAVGQVAAATGLPVVLLPTAHIMSDIESLKVMQRALRKKGVKTFMFNRILNTLETSSILRSTEIFIGASLHGAIITLSFGKPAVSFGSHATGKHKGVLSAVGLEICHVAGTDEIPQKAANILLIPKGWLKEKVEFANTRINEYFGRISKVIAAKRSSSISKDWSQERSTGQVIYRGMDDFQKLTEICMVKRQQINNWKKWMYYLIRMNYAATAYYHRFWFYRHRK
jgi:lipopolysaccharide transport system ATP-binding protein